MKLAETLPASKYIRPAAARHANALLECLAMAFLFVYFVMPQYFGIPFPLFDLTAQRIVLLLALAAVLLDGNRRAAFAQVARQVPFLAPLLLYLFVLGYTMLLRGDVKAFLNPGIEFLSFYLLVYFIHSFLGLKKALRCLVIFCYVIAALGLVEYALGRSPFSYLETIHGLYTGQFIRSGQYRIMGPANHSLGYGLMLIAMLPLAALDMEKEEIDLLKHWPLVLLLAANVFFCGSRSTLGVFALELLLLFLFSPKAGRKKLFLAGAALLALFAVFLVAARQTAFARGILVQVTSVLDELLGTSYAAAFGANVNALSSSSNYREQLIHIFGLDWLNPVLGIGRQRSLSAEINGSYIHSVDSFYIAEYVRYAWPGLISYVLYAGCFVAAMLRACFQTGLGVYKALFAGAVCYFINLLWLDSLQTLKYVYLLFALFVLAKMKQESAPRLHKNNAIESRYRKKQNFWGNLKW